MWDEVLSEDGWGWGWISSIPGQGSLLLYPRALPSLLNGDVGNVLSCPLVTHISPSFESPSGSNLFFFNWSIIVLQCCVTFCCTMKRISCIYSYIPSLLDLPLRAPLSHHRARSWAPCALWQVPTSYLLYIRQCMYVGPNLPVGPTLPFPPWSTAAFSTCDSCGAFSHIPRTWPLFFSSALQWEEWLTSPWGAGSRQEAGL